MSNLSFVTLLAYDYKYAFKAIESYYEIADEIILGLDIDRISWSGNQFNIDMSEVQLFIEKYDRHKKIIIIEANFHSFATAKKNDTTERNYLSRKCKAGNWIIQIDSDEILRNPIEFKSWLANVPDDMLIKAKWINVFKTFPDQGMCLVVDGAIGGPNVGTKRANAYILHRRTRQKQLESPLELLHFSWGRSLEDLRQKLSNWSHQNDFDVFGYLQFWERVTLSNYQNFTNIHPLEKESWPKLKAIPMESILRVE